MAKKKKKATVVDKTPEAPEKTDEELKAVRKERLHGFLVKIGVTFLIFSMVGTLGVLWMSSTTTITQYPDPTSYFYIEDYSGVLTAETEDYIYEQAVALQQATKAQIVAVTVPETQSDSLEDYSNTLANRWGIGDADLDNGVLLLFTTGDPHVRMEVGSGLGGCLPDAKAGRILDDYAVEDKDNGRWNAALRNTWTATAIVLYEEYDITPPKTLAFVDEVEENVKGETLADAPFPEAIVEENEFVFPGSLLASFVVFWLFGIIPYGVVCLIFYGSAFPRGYAINDRSRGFYSGDDTDSSPWSSDSSWDSGGWSVGGGDFDGGGASR